MNIVWFLQLYVRVSIEFVCLSYIVTLRFYFKWIEHKGIHLHGIHVTRFKKP